MSNELKITEQHLSIMRTTLMLPKQVQTCFLLNSLQVCQQKNLTCFCANLDKQNYLEHIFRSKGQIISEEIFLPTKIFDKFLPQHLKSGQIKKIKELLNINYGLFNVKCLYFCQDRNLSNFFVGTYFGKFNTYNKI